MTASITAVTYFGPVVFYNTEGTIGPAEIAERVLFVAALLAAYLVWREPVQGIRSGTPTR